MKWKKDRKGFWSQRLCNEVHMINYLHEKSNNIPRLLQTDTAERTIFKLDSSLDYFFWYSCGFSKVILLRGDDIGSGRRYRDTCMYVERKCKQTA